MKTRTPQILWHSESDKKINAGLTSLALCGNVLATASNVPDVHLWNIAEARPQFLQALTRHDSGVYAVAFSPHQRCLASAGNGSVIVWTLPEHGSWSTVQAADLHVSIVYVTGTNLTDLSWSPDSTQLFVSALDHSVSTITYKNGSWKTTSKQHPYKHNAQGVAWDPLDVYKVSMSADKLCCIQTAGKTKIMKHLEFEQHSIAFCDETRLASFVRRLAWTPDGAYLILPAATVDDRNATLVLARHQWQSPAKIWMGMNKPCVAICPHPLRFELPPNAKDPLPYRCLVAVLTWDTVYLYDTHHSQPLAVATGLHYANLVQGTWSDTTLYVCSTDGYLSAIEFDEGELGTVYKDDLDKVQRFKTVASPVKTMQTSVQQTAVSMTPRTLQGRSKKRVKVTTPPKVTPNVLVAKKKKRIVLAN